MIETPRIINTQARAAAVIRLTIPRAQMQQAMGPAIGEVMAVVAAQRLTPVGPLFSHHFKMDPSTFDFEVGLPISSPVTPTGRVQRGELPASRVARTIYRGPYEGLGDAWCEFEKWIKYNGHDAAPNLWECYLSGPESGQPASAWETQLNRPLLD
jgi:effector-binding domain-containing protein